MRTVLITGCSSGIGYATAALLKKKGYHVLATCKQQKDAVRLRKEGFDSFKLDVRSSKDITHAVSLVRKKKLHIHALFNNAGIAIPSAVEDQTRDVMREQFETNLFGGIELTNKLMPILRKQRRSYVIFNSSVLGFVSFPYRGSYNPTKYAMEGYVDSMRLEAPKHIKLVLVEPGPITTNLSKNSLKNYNKYIVGKQSEHKTMYAKLLKRLRSTQATIPGTLPASAVARKVLKIIETRNPNPRYYITFPTYIMGFLKRILPARMLDAIVIRFL